MAQLKLTFLALFLGIILFACNDSKTVSNTPAPAAKAKVAASNPTSTPAAKVQKKTPTSNAKAVAISGKNVSTKSGGDFCIDVQVTNFVDVISMQYSTNWDPKVLEYKGVQNFVLKDLTKQNFGRGNGEESTLRLSWYVQDLKGITLFDGATIYQVCFRAIAKSGTTTEVDFANKPMIGEIANSKMQKIKTDLKSVKVTIE